LKIENAYPGSTILILPSDHLIKGEKNFTDLLLKAGEVAEKKSAVLTIGIEPTYPETGYGYIHVSSKQTLFDDQEYYQVENFEEKPDLKTAEKYLTLGSYYWNSGIYITPAKILLEEIENNLNQLYNKCKKIMEISEYQNLSQIGQKTKIEKIKELYEKLENISIEYGVIEKLENLYLLKADFIWDDLGSWTSLERVNKKNSDNNIVVGKHLGIDTNDSIIYSCNRIVTTIGIKNLIIVNTGDAVLICDKNKAQDIKELRNLIEKENLDEYL
jgi:mannose-1-phosphate guanylyltransferase